MGFLNTSPWGEVADATRHLLDDCVRRLTGGGAQVRDLASPSCMASWREIQDVVFGWEMLQALAYERVFRRNDVEPRTKQMFKEYEQRLTPKNYEIGLGHAREAGRECADLFHDCDVLLVPAAVGEAPEGIDHTGDGRFNGVGRCCTCLA
nr:hypothetical protein [Bradyrhizobium sp. WSM471]